MLTEMRIDDNIFGLSSAPTIFGISDTNSTDSKNSSHSTTNSIKQIDFENSIQIPSVTDFYGSHHMASTAYDFDPEALGRKYQEERDKRK